MKQPIDLRPDHAQIVHEIIARYLSAGVSVRVFGSRAKWSAKPHSDLDLAVKGKGPLPRSVVGDLVEAFSESDLPFRVDVVDWHTVAPSFQEVIDRDGLPLTVPLGQVATLLSGGTPSKANSSFWNGDIPWLTPKDMGLWEGATNAHVTKAAIGKGTRLAPANASFVAVRGMSLHNEIRVVQSARPISFNQDIKAVVAGPTIDPDFLYFALTAAKPILLGLVSAAGHGTGVLDTDRLRSLEIPALPLDEQRTIAETVGVVDDRIELNRRMSETLEGIAQTIFRDWFVDFGPTRRKAAGEADPVAIMGGLSPDPARAAELAALFPAAFDDDGLPVGWKSSQVGDWMDILDSKRIPLSSRQREERQGNIPYHGATSVMGYVDTHLFDEILLLIGEDGSVVRPDGKPFTQYVWGKIWVNNHAHVLRGKGVTTEHLKCFFEQVDIAPFVTGAVQPKLNQANMKAIPFIAATDAVHMEFGALIEPLFALIRAAIEETNTLAETRDYLLPRLMSGAVRVAPKVEAA